jgi:hypothetical protein
MVSPQQAYLVADKLCPLVDHGLQARHIKVCDAHCTQHPI